MRLLLICVLALALAACTTSSPKHSLLMGRWHSDTAPTGYWIIDRYTDGRFAEKQFLSYDYAKPTEILLTWGTWKLKGKKYEQTIQGSTSPFVSKFIGRTSVFPVQSLSEDQFAWENKDGEIRRENRISGNTPLPALFMKPTPRNATDPDYVVKTTSLESAPQWMNGTPH
jgi:hypothetical protein